MRAGSRWSLKEPESQPVQDRQLGKEHKEERRKVQPKEERIVPCVMGRDQEQTDGNTGQPFLGWGVLGSFIDLFPERQLVVDASVGFKGCTCDVVEHDVRQGHVSEVDEGPGSVLLHGGDDVEQDFGEEDEDDVDDPGTLVVDPVGVGVESGGLVNHLFVSLFDAGDGYERGRSCTAMWWTLDGRGCCTACRRSGCVCSARW